jgi:chromosome segregation ATPase
MRPVEVSDAEIIEAGQALRAAGQRITGFALRKHLDNKGTPKRLHAVWLAHAAQAAAPAAPPAPDLPPEVAHTLQAVSADLVAKLASLAGELNSGAVRAAEQRVARALDDADQVRLQADQELADASQAVEELEAQVADLRAALVAERAKLTSAGEDAQRQAVELATVRERLTAAELAARQAAEVHAAEVAQLRAQLDQVRADLTGQLTEQTAQARAAQQHLADEREQRQADRATAAKEAHRQAERFTEVQHERDTARQQAQEARESAARLQGEVQALRSHGAELAALLKAFGTEPPAGASTTPPPARRKGS